MKNKLSNIRVIDFSLSSLVIIYFFLIFFKYTVNIPINDDYGVLNDINEILNTDSFLEKIKLFFSQHNEHRIAYDRFWFLVSYKINNQINFNLLALIGNLSLIILFFLLIKRISLSNNYFILLPISILLFNLTFYENMTFSMAALSNFTVILFSLLTLNFLTSTIITNTRFLFAIIFCFLAMYTQGGGLFVVPVSLLILFLKKDYKRFKYFAIIGILLYSIYFLGYEKPLNSPSILDSVINFKMKTLLYFLAFLGNSFSFNLIFNNGVSDSLMLSSIIGAAFLSFYIYLFIKRYYNKNPFNFSIMTLVITIAIVTGLTRSQLGIDTAIASRYRILSIIFLISVLIKVFEYLELKKISELKVNGSIIVFSVLYFINFSKSQEEYLYYRERQSLKGVINYYSGNYKLLNGFEQEFYKKVIENSRKNETYFLPSKKELEDSFPYSSKKEISMSKLDSNSLYINIEEITKLYDSYYIEGWAFIENQNASSQKVWVGISNENGIKFYNTQSVNRYDLNPYFKKDYIENGGFFTRIKLENLTLGINKVSIYTENKGIKKIIQTDKIITIQ